VREKRDSFTVDDVLASRLEGAGGGLLEQCLHRSDYDGLASCLHRGATKLLPDWLSRGWSCGWLQHLYSTHGTTCDCRVTVCPVLTGHTARLMSAVCRFDASACARGRILSGRFVRAHCSVEGGVGVGPRAVSRGRFVQPRYPVRWSCGLSALFDVLGWG